MRFKPVTVPALRQRLAANEDCICHVLHDLASANKIIRTALFFDDFD